MAVVLVVEDDVALNGVVCRALAGAGHTPIQAVTGAEALARARRQYPDLALLDLRLPDTDGLRIFQTLRRDIPRLTGVVMTAYGSVPSAVECLHAGITEYLEKPFSLEALLGMVNELVAPSSNTHGHHPSSSPQAVPVAAHRRLALALVRSVDDLNSSVSFAAWSRTVFCAERTLRVWCEAAHVKPRAAHDFRRGLTAVIVANHTGISPVDLLGYDDPRSATRFCARCGALHENGIAWTAGEYCRRQQVLLNAHVVGEVLRLLTLRGLV